ncbi:MAG: adenylate kinase family protein, partial [bacterium]
HLTISFSIPTDHKDDKPRPLSIIIAGAPASGKGTQCEVIKELYDVVHLSTGDILRAAVAARTPVGIVAKGYMDAGKLVPDEVIINIVKDRLQEEDCQTRGWLLDGFPRTKAQAEALKEAGVCADCFIFLNVPDEILVERVVGRRTDPVTGKIYHVKYFPPPE